MGKTIAILVHEALPRKLLPKYVIYHMAQHWEDDGYKIIWLFGPKTFIPADLIFVHVDLSVVPTEYLEFASRYPRQVNHRAKDIRKSAISRYLLQADDTYSGQVIVKTDLNFAGQPERMLSPSLWTRLAGRLRMRISGGQDYQVFSSLEAVPSKVWRDERYVVERFLPEKCSSGYRVRHFHFLGNRWTCNTMTAREPIVIGSRAIELEPVKPHPEIVALRHQLGFDYGKFDYCLHKGEPILFDINKTTGAGSITPSEQLVTWRRHRAEGIACFF